MNNDKVKYTFHGLMDMAGIKVNGPRPYDIQVKNDNLYQRVLSKAALGLGESYMDQWWECKALDRFIDKILRADLVNKIRQDWNTTWEILKARIINLQKPDRAFMVGQKHYDVGNDLYQAMLDKRMQYTCGYWEAADTLESAQKAKLELVCRKIGLKPGMKVLELGCGFGGFARYAAQKYDAHVTGFTVSREQAAFSKKQCRGLPVDIRLDDYRNASGLYDRVVSIGMMEHVGYKNYRAYMELTNRLLKDEGIAFVHTIGSNVSRKICNPWTVKYIFPNSSLPSIAFLGKAMEGLFVVEDWHNFGEDYDKTLMAWHENFKKAWPGLKEKYDERFYRMWTYYLLSCAGGFRSRSMQLWQIVMTKPGRTRPDCRIN
ncbi:cyclopropane fatty acyl phospholipid synthase [Desulfobacula phenolica]|uniref:Cyclopropane-fatty-acyl-phospholipid synthase n=1 Tax=Desulfobacula phenolica TaxID=90732 RepID=A0A1H2DQE5_9BACT|nr:cyclopropane fatty acyl phospholipid synthase [Desulfobacula phenolica]SDT84961.1 cyclopropane-fatty-acyl-phospholipid synthase [Desulfobacula phenolica]